MNALMTGLRRPCLRIVVAGRLVLGPRTDWRGWRPVVDAAAGRMLALDLRRVSQIDAAGLGLLVALSTYMRQRGGRLRLLRASRRVRTLVQVTGLCAVLGLVHGMAESRARRRRDGFTSSRVTGTMASSPSSAGCAG